MVFANLFQSNRPRDIYRRLSKDRKALIGKTDNDLINRLLNSPLPELNQRIEETHFLVFDFETTGLSYQHDHILSMGWCNVEKGKVLLNEAEHFYIKQPSTVSFKSAVVNHITPEVIKTGLTLDVGVARLLRAMEGKVAVAHGTVIEKKFLEHYFKQSTLKSPFPLMWIDTLLFEKYFPTMVRDEYQQDYRLSTIRDNYQLPTYLSHNALIDAVATAELLICQISRARKLKEMSTLEDLLKASVLKV